MGHMKDHQIDLMNKNAYIVNTTPATKVTVTISRRQMWENYLSVWSDLAWDEYRGVMGLKTVADVLLCGDGLLVVCSRIKDLFRDGHTMAFMGSAMKELDNGPILREIIVQDRHDVTGEVQDSIVISHQDILF